MPRRAEGRKCARSWKISPLVGSDPEFPDVTPRDAEALRELRRDGVPVGRPVVNGRDRRGVVAIGAVAAVLTLAADQASKLWLLRDFDLAARSPYSVAPGVDLLLAWNRGISYSLLTADSDGGRYLLIGATLLATLLIVWWLWRSTTRTTGLALGLLIGGAVGNLIDRVLYGAVVDFVFIHSGSFRWYIFNGADCAIVAGVGLLLYEWVMPREGAGRPQNAAIVTA